jgi:hypothetical protein
MAGRRRSILALALLTSCFHPLYSTAGNETVTYAYDARGRLIQVSRSGTVNDGIQASYGYDKADNRTNVTVTTSTPTLSINSASATEGAPVVFTVTRGGSASGTVTVNYATSGGTATSAADFTAGSGTLTFVAGDTSEPINIATTDDAAVEGVESFTVTLSSPSAGSAIGTGTGTGTINDNDSAPTCGGASFTIASNAAVTEGSSSIFTVSKAGTASGSCTVNWATANGTAASGSDYTAASGTLTFAAVDTVKTFSVLTTDDAAVESAETFTASLSGPSGGATLGTPSSATTTINDNDSGGGTGCSGVSFRVNDVANDEGVPLVFTVTKTGTTSTSCSVSYASANGTAITPNDYAAVSGTLTFLAAETTKTVSITTTTTGPGEGTETMNLNLSSPSGGATISDSQGVGTIYNYVPDGGGGCPLC